MPPIARGDLSPPRYEAPVRPKSQFQALPSRRRSFSGIESCSLLSLSEVGDQVLWDYAKENGFAIVSQDADFAEMAVLQRSPPKVIWLRAGNQSTEDVSSLLLRHADLILAFGDDLEAACLEIY